MGMLALVANLVAEHFDGNFGVYDLGGEVDKTITIRNDVCLEARNFSLLSQEMERLTSKVEVTQESVEHVGAV